MRQTNLVPPSVIRTRLLALLQTIQNVRLFGEAIHLVITLSTVEFCSRNIGKCGSLTHLSLNVCTKTVQLRLQKLSMHITRPIAQCADERGSQDARGERCIESKRKETGLASRKSSRRRYVKKPKLEMRWTREGMSGGERVRC